MNRVGSSITRASVLAAALAAVLGASAGPALALDLDPFEYYEFDYEIAFSHESVGVEEPFTVALGIDVRCIKDMPIGANEADVSVDIVARPLESGDEIVLRSDFAIRIDDVPDWAGESLAIEESAEMSFPSGTPSGQYEVVAKVDTVAIDGWNVTPLIPGGYKSIPLGNISCTNEEPAPIPQQAEPGTLGVFMLGHRFSPAIDEDGILLEALDAELIEGQVSLTIEERTRCIDSAAQPLENISVVRDTSPEAYPEGLVLAAYHFQPTGARFSPTATIGIAFSELPVDVVPGNLILATYDTEDEVWQPLNATLDEAHQTLSTQAYHFSTYAILVPTSETLPALLTERDLAIRPAQVPPYKPVEVSVVVENTGGSPGTYQFALAIDGRTEHAEDVAVSPGEIRTIRVVVSRGLSGDYDVTVGSLSAEFTVVSPTDASSGTDQDDTSGAATSPLPASQPSAPDSATHPAYIALLILAGVAFLTLVVLVLAGVL